MKATEHMDHTSLRQNAFVKLLKAFHPKPGLIRTATELRDLDIKVSVDVFKGGSDR